MAYLVDTSVLGRLANTADPFYDVALRAVTELHHAGETLHSTPQVLIEFRNAATRPVMQNGLGLAPLAAEKKSALFEAAFPLLPDTPAIYPAWKSLVQTGSVIGKQVHDARIVAVCRVHGITHLLTFNVGHFTRLTSFEPGLAVIDPSTV